MADSDNTPLVSVIIPLYNASPYIREMLECIEAQTYKNWELIIVDDGSTDDSCDIVNEYVTMDSRIKLLHRTDDRIKGANSCRNMGYEFSQGVYIMWLDGDDLVTENCIQNRVNFLEIHPNIDFCVTPAMGFQKEIGDFYWIVGTKSNKNSDYRNFLRILVPFQVVTNLYRKSSLDKFNIRWDERLMGRQDPDFNLSVIQAGLLYEYTENPIDYFWRINGLQNSISSQLNSKSKISANLYYFRKRSEYEKKFNRKALTFLSLHIFKIILNFKKSSDIENFLETPFFRFYPSLFYKYRWISALVLKHDLSNNITSLLISLLFPYASLNSYILTKIFVIKSKIKAHREIKRIKK